MMRIDFICIEKLNTLKGFTKIASNNTSIPQEYKSKNAFQPGKALFPPTLHHYACITGRNLSINDDPTIIHIGADLAGDHLNRHPDFHMLFTHVGNW